MLAIVDLDALVEARAATLLDQELLSENPRALHDAGFDLELLETLVRRQD